ncbi:hypothetical protein HDU67_006091 [Dinochytrium kinnereticum]|nr:hypothetical protein HDU67_006091 [Dinochytrium kinnereticum]
MYTLLSGLYTQWSRKEEFNVVILGLDNAGKTTLLERIKATYTTGRTLSPEQIGPTIGLNIGKIELQSVRLNFWDLGGQRDLLRIWSKYYTECHGVIFVIDSTDEGRIQDVKDAFGQYKMVISSDLIEGVPVLMLANKADMPGALSVADVKERFNDVAMKLGARDSKVMAVSALRGEGVRDAIDWLYVRLDRNREAMAPSKAKAKAPASKPSATGPQISPYAVFRAAEAPAPQGCSHLAELKHDPPGAGPEFTQAAKDLVHNFREAVRHSLGYLNRSQLQITKKIALTALSKKGDEDEETSGKKRKKPSGVDTEIQAIEQVFCIKEKHLHTHLDSKGHTFAVDMGHHNLYCRLCKDYVYDIDFDRIIHSERFRIDNIVSKFKGVKRVRCQEWSPSIEEAKTIKRLSTPAKKCSGLRGLRNMGSTCFMNVVLQTFMHNPLMRLHFMSDKHNQDLCKYKIAKQVCIACELDNLYAQFYSGQSTPYGPTSFLYSMWKSNAALAAYAQQDSHEFFMSVLNLVHNSCSGLLEHNQNSTSCKCIIHTVFAGSLQSDVTCQKCHNITTTHDPIFDLSLTIRHSKSSKSGKSGSKKKSSAPGGGPSLDASPGDLKAELKVKGKDEHSEKLTAYQCGNPECAKTEHALQSAPSTPGTPSKEIESIKHVTVKTLPPVLAIQLKRFEHSGQGSKVETFVKIPLELDMTPYTTRSVKARTKKNKKDASGSKKHSSKQLLPFDPQTDSVPEYRYSLFAVINHQGKLETGHYTAYVKCRGDWFFFDDHNVQLSSQKDVLNSKVYMCFYVRENHMMSPSVIIEGQESLCNVNYSDGPSGGKGKVTELTNAMIEDELMASAEVSPTRDFYDNAN